MNKKFISALLFGALLFASTSTFVSCSYDEDITELRGELATLQSLVDSKEQEINKAIAALTTQADELKAKYDAALENLAAEDTKAQAEVAKIAASLALVESAVADLQAGLAAETATLREKDEELSVAIIAATAKADQALALIGDLEDVVEGLRTQTTTLSEEVKALQESVQQNVAAIAAQEAIVAELSKWSENAKTELKDLKDAIDAAKDAAAKAIADAKSLLEGAIAENADAIKALQDTVAGLVADVANIQDRLEKFNSDLAYEGKRLKSLVFVPTSYVNGIECINFVTLKYKNWVEYNADAANGDDNEYHIGDSATTIEYLVNPKNVLADDIVGLSFISNEATNTRAVSENAPIAVKEFGVKNGVMAVKVYKNTTESFGTDRKNFTIVSLKATLSDKFLTDEEKANEEKAEVYSDWARLHETSVTPYIHNRLRNNNNTHVEEDDTAHFWKFSEVYGSLTADPENTTLQTIYNDQHVAAEVVYSESIDLMTLVEVCDKNGKHYDPAAYGLEFKFKVMDYLLQNENATTDATNQKYFAKLDGTLLTSTARNNETEKNRDAIGRQPMIQVALLDKVNGKTVDVKYFKIKWVADAPKPESVEVKNFGLFGDFIKPYVCKTEYSAWILEEDVNALYAMADVDGLSRAEFHKKYELADGLYSSLDVIKNKTPEAVTGVGSFAEKADDSGAGQTYNYCWTISTIDQKMTMDDYFAGKKTVSVWGYFKNRENANDRIAFQLQFTWTIDRFALDGYNKDEAMWANGLRHVNPALDSDTKYGNTKYFTTQIVGNLLEGYIKDGKTPKNVLEMVDLEKVSDAKWVFDEEKLTGDLEGYTVENDDNNNVSKLMKGLTVAATLNYYDGNIQLYEDKNGALDSKPTEPSKYLVGKTAPVKIVASYCDLTDEFEHHNVKFLTPLQFKSEEATCELYDITSGGYAAATFVDKFEIREVYTTNKRVVWDNKKVDSKTNEDLVEWYQVSEVIYDLDNATTNKNKDGGLDKECKTLLKELIGADGKQKYEVEMGYDAQGKDLYEVRFYNKSGNAIGQEFDIEIPAKITTKWQDDLNTTIKVTVKPAI